jgi:anti-sigma regulatory factor (Ser/Thr protein kinase)
VSLEVAETSIVLTFEDDGVPFDPSCRIDPVPAKSLEDAALGGLGLMLVRRATTTLDYRRTADQHNRLVATLALGPSVAT